MSLNDEDSMDCSPKNSPTTFEQKKEEIKREARYELFEQVHNSEESQVHSESFTSLSTARNNDRDSMIKALATGVSVDPSENSNQSQMGVWKEVVQRDDQANG